VTVGPLSNAPYIERLRAIATALRLVAGAAELEAALSSAAASVLPSAYVLIARESAAESRGGTQRVIQRVTVDISVVYAVRNYRTQDLGSAAGADLESVIRAGRAALIGWTPDAVVCDPTVLLSGRLERRRGAELWWQDILRTRYRLEATP
jgi:hypothetical protein